MDSINIFSHMVDPEGVLGFLREIAPSLEVVESDDENNTWKQVDLILTSGSDPITLSFRHDPSYYRGDNWAKQLAGMQVYFQSFPDSPNKPKVMELVRSFRFALSVVVESDFTENDGRAVYMLAVAEYLDGVLFTPDSLRDARGKVLLDQNEPADPEAKFPRTPTQQVSEPVPPSEEPAPPSEEIAPPSEEPEEKPGLSPPTALRVARRTLAIAAVCGRALLEQENPKDVDVEQNHHRILNWVSELELKDEFEPAEWELVRQPHGKIDAQELVNATWRFEGLGVLAWALKLFEIPSYDRLVPPWDLLREVYFLHMKSSKELLASPELRSTEELDKQSLQLLAVHWRLRDYWQSPRPMDFVAFSKDCWFGSFDMDALRTIDNDLALEEHAISKAPKELFTRCHSAAHERHQAIRWLLGHSEIYSETDVST